MARKKLNQYIISKGSIWKNKGGKRIGTTSLNDAVWDILKCCGLECCGPDGLTYKGIPLDELLAQNPEFIAVEDINPITVVDPTDPSSTPAVVPPSGPGMNDVLTACADCDPVFTLVSGSEVSAQGNDFTIVYSPTGWIITLDDSTNPVTLDDTVTFDYEVTCPCDPSLTTTSTVSVPFEAALGGGDDPEYTVDKTADVTEAPVGGFVTFTITVTNTGTVPTEDIILFDPITEPCIGIVSVTIATTHPSGTTSFDYTDGRIDISALQVGEVATITYDVKILEDGEGTCTEDIAEVVNTVFSEDGTTPAPGNPEVTVDIVSAKASITNSTNDGTDATVDHGDKAGNVTLFEQMVIVLPDSTVVPSDETPTIVAFDPALTTTTYTGVGPFPDGTEKRHTVYDTDAMTVLSTESKYCDIAPVLIRLADDSTAPVPCPMSATDIATAEAALNATAVPTYTFNAAGCFFERLVDTIGDISTDDYVFEPTISIQSYLGYDADGDGVADQNGEPTAVVDAPDGLFVTYTYEAPDGTVTTGDSGTQPYTGTETGDTFAVVYENGGKITGTITNAAGDVVAVDTKIIPTPDVLIDDTDTAAIVVTLANLTIDSAHPSYLHDVHVLGIDCDGIVYSFAPVQSGQPYDQNTLVDSNGDPAPALIIDNITGGVGTFTMDGDTIGFTTKDIKLCTTGIYLGGAMIPSVNCDEDVINGLPRAFVCGVTDDGTDLTIDETGDIGDSSLFENWYIGFDGVPIQFPHVPLNASPVWGTSTGIIAGRTLSQLESFPASPIAYHVIGTSADLSNPSNIISTYSLPIAITPSTFNKKWNENITEPVDLESFSTCVNPASYQLISDGGSGATLDSSTAELTISPSTSVGEYLIVVHAIGANGKPCEIILYKFEMFNGCFCDATVKNYSPVYAKGENVGFPNGVDKTFTFTSGVSWREYSGDGLYQYTPAGVVNSGVQGAPTFDMDLGNGTILNALPNDPSLVIADQVYPGNGIYPIVKTSQQTASDGTILNLKHTELLVITDIANDEYYSVSFGNFKTPGSGGDFCDSPDVISFALATTNGDTFDNSPYKESRAYFDGVLLGTTSPTDNFGVPPVLTFNVPTDLGVGVYEIKTEMELDTGEIFETIMFYEITQCN